jgi:hypothetical protein
MDPVVPAMQNTDGEPLEFLTLHFAIDSQAAVEAAIANLKMITTAVRAQISRGAASSRCAANGTPITALPPTQRH